MKSLNQAVMLIVHTAVLIGFMRGDVSGTAFMLSIVIVAGFAAVLGALEEVKA